MDRQDIYNWIKGKIYLQLFRNARASNTPCFILINTPEYGNMGDQAITEGELEFLRLYFPDYKVIELAFERLQILKSKIKDVIQAQDVICINGGGYIGTLWPQMDNSVHLILSLFPEHTKIMFPQTVYYETDQTEVLSKGKEKYQTTKHFLFFLREKTSYQFMLNHQFLPPEYVKLVPDMVLMLQKKDPTVLRKNVLLCMRSDKEKAIDFNLSEKIEQFCMERKLPLVVTDTVIPGKVLPFMRTKKLEKKLSEFRQAKLVITDRLHGMIFAAITGTPCLAFNNISKKVEGVYEWIQYLPYISFHDKGQLTQSEFDDMLSLGDCQFEQAPLMHEFQKMAEEIRCFIEGENNK